MTAYQQFSRSFRIRKATLCKISSVLITVFSLHSLLGISPARADGYVNYLTQHNDSRRSGANLSEDLLNPSNVNIYQFGKLYSRLVDGQIYAQPLIMSGITIPGKGVHNVVFIATMHDSVYAFDADSNAGDNANPLWQVNLTNPALGITSVPVTAFSSNDIKLEVGILGTPVIDPASKTLYAVTWTLERTKTDKFFVYRLHALSVTDGSEKFGGPVVIQGAVPGTGDSTDGLGNVVFVPRQHLQRPALLLHDGVVYVSFGSHGDSRPYHGWVMGYDADTLQMSSIMCTTPNGWGGSIWQGGQGPTVDDDDNIYVMTANGSVDYANLDYSMSILKMNTGLQISDFFMPYNAYNLSAHDYDLGSSGVLAIPNTERVLGGGKQARVYMLDTANLGQFNGITDNTIQNFMVPGQHIHGTPVWWHSSVGNLIYVWSEVGNLNSYIYDQDQFTRSAISTILAPPGMPGGFLTLSADGTDASTGVVWANIRVDAKTPAYGVMRAFDARSLKELWNSEMNPDRDRTGLFAKFVPPTVANGKVYMATFSNAMQVYGPKLLTHTPVISPGSTQFYPTLTVSITDDMPNAEIHYTLDGSSPTKSSALYTAPFTISATTVVMARAFVNGIDDSIAASATFTSAASLNFLAAADAYVKGGASADVNYPTGLISAEKATNVKQPWMNKVAYLQFDLTNVTKAPATAVLNLNMDGSSTPHYSTAHISCYGIPGAVWSENSITFNNAPGLNTLNTTSTGILASIQSIVIISGPVTFDVKSYIASHLGQVITLQLIDEQPEGLYTAFTNREAKKLQPLLSLTW